MYRLKILFILIGIITTSTLLAQMPQPVRWGFDCKRSKDDKLTLIFRCSIEKGWKLYAQDNGTGGPVALSFTLESYEGKLLQQRPIPSPQPTQIFDIIFDMPLTVFKDKAQWTQVIDISHLDHKPYKISGYLTYMVCDNERCLPPQDVDFCFFYTPPKQSQDDIPTIRVGYKNCQRIPASTK